MFERVERKDSRGVDGWVEGTMGGMEEEDGMEEWKKDSSRRMEEGRVGWVREKGWRSIQEEDGEKILDEWSGGRVRSYLVRCGRRL